MNIPACEKRRSLFLAVSRVNRQDRPHREEVTATSEQEARALLAGRFILCFAGRLPLSPDTTRPVGWQTIPAAQG